MAITLHEGQSDVFDALFISKTCRYGVVDCSRGWGKSYLAGAAATTAIFELLELREDVPNKIVYIIAPTYDQVTDIYYPLINYDLGMERYALRSSRDLGRFIFPKKVELRLLSYEAVERMRGKGAYFVVWDEVSSCYKGITAKEAWQSVVKPCISTRWSPMKAQMFGARSPGRGLFIGTPKGFNYFYDLFNYREVDPQWKSWKFDYTTSPLLDPLEIEQNRALMDPVEFASEYLADFKESGNSVFYCFDRSKHVLRDIPYFDPPIDGEMGEDVHVTIDFNVGLQCSAAGAIRGNKLYYLDEFKGHPDTETLAQVLKAKYAGHKIYAYPDPSGRARKTSAPVGRTDFSILQAAGITCLARPKAPPIKDSVAAVNRKLLTANGDIGMYVHSRCTGLVTSLERTKWADNNPDIAVIDKSESIEHYGDGVRYITEYKWPVRSGTKVASRGFAF